MRAFDFSAWLAAGAPTAPNEVYVLADANMFMSRRARPQYGSLSTALLEGTNIHPCVIPSTIEEILAISDDDVRREQLDRFFSFDPVVLPEATSDFHHATAGSYTCMGPTGEIGFRPEVARDGAPFDCPDAAILAAGSCYGLPVLTDNWRIDLQRRGHPLRGPAFCDVSIVPIGDRASMSSVEDVSAHLGSVSTYRGLGTFPSSYDPDFHSQTMASLSTNRSALFGGSRVMTGASALAAAMPPVGAVTTAFSGMTGP